MFQLRVEAYDLGIPTPLSSDLDLSIYVRNVNDHQPQFLIDEFTINFTGNEKKQIACDNLVRDASFRSFRRLFCNFSPVVFS